MSREGPSFSHLFFTDDLILFSKATKKNCLSIMRVLVDFCTSSGQKVNHSKSKIFFSPHIRAENVSFNENELGMNRTNIFSKYLNVSIITDGWDKRAFDYIVDKIRIKLSSWNARTLSMVGRLTLIHSVTSAMPTHLMQCTLLPSRIYTELNKINNNFFWGNSTTSKKLHPIKWDVVSELKHLGGLGIKKSSFCNRTLLAKRAWAIHTDSDNFWAETFRKKYLTTSNTTKRKSTVWTCLSKAKDICDNGTRWLIPNGETVHFWYDDWTGNGPLQNLIQGPLHANDISLKVRDTQGNWNFSILSFVLPNRIHNIIWAMPKPFSSSLADLPMWNLSPNGQFNPHSAYLLASKLPLTTSYTWNWLWKSHTIPSRDGNFCPTRGYPARSNKK